MDNIVKFPGTKAGDRPRSKSSGRPYRVRGGKNRFTLLFRSRETILESDEAELVRDVCFDVDRAQAKLERIQQRLANLRDYAATEIQSLTDADTKLSAAIVAALLSNREGKSNGS